MKPSDRVKIVKDFVEVLEKEAIVEGDDKYMIILGIAAAIAREDDNYSVVLNPIQCV